MRVSVREILKKNGFDLDLTDEILDTEFDAMYTYKETGTAMAGDPFEGEEFEVDEYVFTHEQDRLVIRPDDPVYTLIYSYNRPYGLKGGVVLAPDCILPLLSPVIADGLLDAAGIFLSNVTDEQRAKDRAYFKEIRPEIYELLYGDD